MIIKSYRIPTAESLSRIREHLFRGPENASVRILRGCEADLDDFRRPALATGSTYAIRHFVVAPQISLTEAQYLDVVNDLGREFGFDPMVCVVFLHEKPRAVEASPTHLHVLVPEVDPVTGGILDDSHDYLRHEKLARLAEWRHRHPLLEGEHLEAVLRHLEREGHSDLCRALRNAYPDALGRRQAFTTPSAAKAQRVAGLDLARLKQGGRAAWTADPTPVGLAAWIVAEGLTLGPGEKPHTLVLSKDGVHIASLNRFLGLRKGPTFEDLRHVPDLVAAHLAALERRDRDPRRDAHDPPPNGRSVSTFGRGSGIGDGPVGGDPRRADSHLEGVGGRAGQPSSPASAARSLDVFRVRQRTLGARLRLAATDATLDRLTSLREAASKVAVTACGACLRWIEDGLAAIEAERARLTGSDDHLDDEIERLAHRARLMKEARDGCERDLAHSKVCMAQIEQGEHARSRWGWFVPKPAPEARKKACEHLEAAEGRFRNAVKMDKDAAGAEARERQRVARLRKDAKASLPNDLAALDCRAELLRTFGHLVAAEPQIAYGGPRAFESWTSDGQQDSVPHLPSQDAAREVLFAPRLLR